MKYHNSKGDVQNIFVGEWKSFFLSPKMKAYCSLPGMRC